MQKKAILYPIIALTLLLKIAPTSYQLVFASSPSPSLKPSLSPSPSPKLQETNINEVTENLKKRLQETLDESASPSPSPQATRAYIGRVKDVIKDTLIIEDKDGKKDIKLEDATTILRSPGNAAIKAENIRIDDYIIAIGYPRDNDVLTGRRIIVSTEPIKVPAKTSAIGTVAKIGKNTLTVKLPDKDQLIDLTAKTIVKSPSGTIELTDLSIGDTIIFTATIGDKDTLTATVIMRTSTAAIE